ncbi:MAG: hypothetical protein KAU10_04865 [Dehalococcoidia bacterium]|nr:hypothetical protein [Dehalococcoidia bacterium]
MVAQTEKSPFRALQVSFDDSYRECSRLQEILPEEKMGEHELNPRNERGKEEKVVCRYALLAMLDGVLYVAHGAESFYSVLNLRI